jgi:hypothetical protein
MCECPVFGLCGARALSFAAENNCRVILSGDTRQHHSVERGDAPRILEKSATVASATLNKIFRQQIPALRAAIEDLSQGKIEGGFDKLDEFGAIREIARTDERIRAICELHIGALKGKQSSLIVAPTRGEARRIAAAVRKELRAQGLIEEPEHTFTRLEKLNLTKAQREDAINYLPGRVVEFHGRAADGFKSGEQWQVIGSQGPKEIVVERNGEQRFLPLAQAGKFTRQLRRTALPRRLIQVGTSIPDGQKVPLQRSTSCSPHSNSPALWSCPG